MKLPIRRDRATRPPTPSHQRLGRFAALAAGVTTTAALLIATSASAAIVPTVPLGTSANFAVLGASTVTNINATVLNGDLGLFPGTAVTGFPPGVVNPPSTTEVNNGVAQQAQIDANAAYVNAAGRPINANTPADLTSLILVGGVYAADANGPLGLTDTLVLDGENNADSVFIFQTNSTLITGSGSVVSLINGAQACNVFWQVGSSATLGTGSTFVGTILAQASVTVENSVSVVGRAIALTGAVTLNQDSFTAPGCAPPPPTTTTTTTTTTAPATTTTAPAATTTTPAATTTTIPAATTTIAAVTTTTAAVASTSPSSTTTTLAPVSPAAGGNGIPSAAATPGAGGPAGPAPGDAGSGAGGTGGNADDSGSGVAGESGVAVTPSDAEAFGGRLPVTGASSAPAIFASLALALGALTVGIVRRKRLPL